MATTRLGQDRIGYLLIAPFYLFFFFFVAVPIVINLALSFTNFDLRRLSFVGLQNYRYLIFTDRFFHKALLNTAVYTVFTLGFTLALSLALAVVLNRELFLRRTYRTVFFLPHVTSMVAVSMIWLWMYEPSQGIFNRILAQLGMAKVAWLHDSRYALGAIIVMGIWKSVGYFIVIYLAGLQTIPHQLYEAATIDGAGDLQKFFRITVPMLKPVTFFLFVTGMINNFNVFEQVLVMTQGGPLNATTTIVHQVYQRAFFDFLMGYGAALAVVAVIIVAIVTLLNFRYGSQRTETEVG